MFSSNLGLRLLVGRCRLKRKECSVVMSYMSSSSVTSEPNFFQTVKAARTSLNTPKDHTTSHIGMWYTVDPEKVHRLYHDQGLNIPYTDLCNILRETSLLIRRPALEVIDYIKRANYDQIPNKYLLYGKEGFGKSLSLSHVLNYLLDDDWIIAHIHSPAKLAVIFKEIVPSVSRPDNYDHTIDATIYLQHFLTQNSKLLEKLQLTTSKTYCWSARESTPEGSLLTSLIDFGIQRAKFASEVVFVLNSELKQLATEAKCKVSVVIDGVNAMYHPVSMFRREDRTIVPVKDFTFVQAFRQFLKPDWKNGCIIGSLNTEMSTKDRRKLNLPRYLLRKEGWEEFDPFVPILVDRFDDREINNYINYFVEKKWVLHKEATSPDGRMELKFMSAGSGKELLSLLNCH